MKRTWMLLTVLGMSAVIVTDAAAGEGLRIGGTGGALGTMQRLGDAFVKKYPGHGPVTILPSLGSSGGIRALQAGAIDVAVASRPLKETEQPSAYEVYEYGGSPFAVVTNRPDVKTLTSRQIAEMVSGQRSWWPDGKPVRVVLRPKSDGDSRYFANMSTDIAAALEVAHQKPGMVIAATDQDAADEIERLPGAIGTSTLSLVVSEGRRMHLVTIDGTEPTVEAVKAGRYKFVKRFFTISRADAGTAVREFVAFLRSPEGRAILTANGHAVPD